MRHKMVKELISIHEKLGQLIFHFFEQPFSCPDTEDPQYSRMPRSRSRYMRIRNYKQNKLAKLVAKEIRKQRFHLNHYSIIGIIFVNKTIVQKQPRIWLWSTPTKSIDFTMFACKKNLAHLQCRSKQNAHIRGVRKLQFLDSYR